MNRFTNFFTIFSPVQSLKQAMNGFSSMAMVAWLACGLLLCLTFSAIPVAHAQAETMESKISSEDAQKKAISPSETYLTISASEQKEVDQDELVAELRIEVEDPKSSVVQEKINSAVKAAVASIKQEPSIQLSTGQYYVYSYDPTPVIVSSAEAIKPERNKKNVIWRGTQSLRLVSKDSEKLLSKVGEIQGQDFVMSNLSYQLSSEKFETEKDGLIEAAIKKLQNKANIVAQSLNKPSYNIVELNLDNSYMPTPQPMVMMKSDMSLSRESAPQPPTAEPGKAVISLNVSARILLKN